MIEMKDYFLLLDGVFTNSSNLSAPLQKSLKECYPILKVRGSNLNSNPTCLGQEWIISTFLYSRFFARVPSICLVMWKYFEHY